MSKKSIPWAQAREDILSDPEVNVVDEAELRAELIREQLVSWRCSEITSCCTSGDDTCGGIKYT